MTEVQQGFFFICENGYSRCICLPPRDAEDPGLRPFLFAANCNMHPLLAGHAITSVADVGLQQMSSMTVMLIISPTMLIHQLH